MMEPNADERERAMGFPTSTTNVNGISKQQRRFLLGQAMDLSCLTWVVSLVNMEVKAHGAWIFWYGGIGGGRTFLTRYSIATKG
jgi:hypothetical protein